MEQTRHDITKPKYLAPDGFRPFPMAEVLTDEEKSVLEAFQKFDKDGSGSISRDELGQVLKSLDPEGWDKDSIDQVLADADASGDGQLQMKEFIRWEKQLSIDGFWGEVLDSSLQVKALILLKMVIQRR